AHGRVQPRVAKVVDAERAIRLEAARDLVLSARARLEQLDAMRDAPIDRLVKADVEMQKRPLFARSPIATVKRIRAEQIERAAEQLARTRIPPEDHVHRLRHLFADLLEKCA